MSERATAGSAQVLRVAAALPQAALEAVGRRCLQGVLRRLCSL